MLKSISITNYILIDNWDVDFSSKLNVITGETGSGKSILIGAIDNVLAGKCSKDVIKTGTDKAVLELTVSLTNKQAKQFLSDNEIDIEDDEVVITREITPTSSKYRINGILVNQNLVREFRSFILDIHSQHQSYTFLQPKYHIQLLDSYAKASCGEKFEKYSKKYSDYLNLKNKLVELQNKSNQTDSQIDFLKFQIEEIENAEIVDIEEETRLNNELSILENAEKLKELTGGIYWNLSNDDNSIMSALSDIKQNLSKSVSLDEFLKDTESMLIDATELLREVSSTLRDYSQNMENDTERLNLIQERLFTFEKLKRKYGGSLEKVLETYEKLSEEYSSIENSQDELQRVEKEIKEHEINLMKLAKEISEERKNYAKVLSSLIEDNLAKLELPKCKFDIAVEETELCEHGIDKVEFMISTNISEPLAPMAKIASGGEISRVMLALKSIFSQHDNIDTVIFDEIDTGISGKTSQAVADEIEALSQYRQIIVITHQPIIAAKADKHLYVKKTQNDTTKVNIYSLSEENRLNALAELASGEITEESLKFAKTLLKS